MRIVSITESSVDKACIVVSPHSVEQIVCSFGTLHRLLFGIIEFFFGQEDSFVEVHDSQVVEATEDIEMDVIFHEFELLVKGIVPNNLKVIHGYPVLFIPIKMFAHQQGESYIHLDCWNIFVDNFESGLVVTEGCHLIAELSYFTHHFSESEGLLLVFDLFEVLDNRLYQISGF